MIEAFFSFLNKEMCPNPQQNRSFRLQFVYFLNRQPFDLPDNIHRNIQCLHTSGILPLRFQPTFFQTLI